MLLKVPGLVKICTQFHYTHKAWYNVYQKLRQSFEHRLQMPQWFFKKTNQLAFIRSLTILNAGSNNKTIAAIIIVPEIGRAKNIDISP